MNLGSILAVGAAAGALLFSVPAAAQSAGAAGSAALPQGPPISGFCVYSQREVLGTSRVGQAVAARLKVLGAQVSAELQPEAESLRTEQQTLQGQSAGLDAATLQTRRANFDLRASNFDKRVQQRQQEMQATQNKQITAVLRELQPVLRNLYVQHRCSVLINADQAGVEGLNPAMDLSSQATVGLDARIQTLTFDREHLDTQPGAAPPR